MDQKPVIHITAVQCKPQDEARLNTWMDEVHIPMLLKFKGLKKASRYKLLYPNAAYPQYITQYEFDSKEAFETYEKSPELAAVREEMAQSWKPGELEMKWRIQYRLLSIKER